MNVSANQTAFYVVWPEFLYSSVCLFGTITVSLSISIFVNKSLKDRTYRFLLIEATVDFFYISMMGSSSLINCGSPCQSRSNTLWAQLIRLCIYDYLTSCLAINNILIEIFISIERLCIVSNKCYFQKLSFQPVVFTIGIFSLLFYTPVLFLESISNLGNGNYQLATTNFGNSEIGRLIPSVLTAIRLLLATVFLFSINVITLIKFKRHLNKKLKLKGNVIC